MKDVPTRSPRQSRLLNVVFVLVDDWGSYDAGWREKEVGRPPVLQTPHLDKLAAHGVRLSNYYVQPICSPTRSALLSARYQIHTGLQDGIIEAHARICLPPAFGTMADAFQALSYSTHMVGKWHLGIYKEDCLPWNRGFDSFYGFLTGSEHHYTKVQRIPRGSGNRSRLFPDFRTQHGPLLSDCLPPTPSPLPPGNPPPAPPAQADEQQRPPRLSESKPGCYSTNVFTSEAVRIISDHHAGRRRTTSTTATPPASRPLFLYLALQAVHEPIEVPARYESIYSEAIADRTRRVYAGQSAPSSPTLQGMVSAVDECLANVSSALAAASATDSTITVVSSDNGGWNGFGGINYPYRGHKTTLWEGGMRAIGLIHAPGIFPPSHAGAAAAPSAPLRFGARVPAPVPVFPGTAFPGLFHVTDWLPTLTRAAANTDVRSLGRQFQGIDGVDQWAALHATAEAAGANRARTANGGVGAAARRGLGGAASPGGADMRDGLAGTRALGSLALGGLSGFPRDRILHNIEGVAGTGAAALRVGRYKLLLNMALPGSFDGWCDACLKPGGCEVPPGASPGATGPAGRLVELGGQLCCYDPPLEGGCPNASSRPPPPPMLLLFDIESDPREQVDLTPSSPVVVAAMLGVLGEYNRTSVPCCICKGSAPDEAEMARPPMGGFWYRFWDLGPNPDPACALMNQPPWRRGSEL